MKLLLSLFDSLLAFGQGDNWKMFIMWAIGGILIYLAIKKEMELNSPDTVIKAEFEPDATAEEVYEKLLNS